MRVLRAHGFTCGCYRVVDNQSRGNAVGCWLHARLAIALGVLARGGPAGYLPWVRGVAEPDLWVTAA